MPRTACANLMFLSVPELVCHLNNVPSVIDAGAIVALLLFIILSFVGGH
jgi:hypothetical protein